MTKTFNKKQFLLTTVLLPIIFIFLSSTNNNSATLEIRIKDCRTNKLEYLYGLSVIKDGKTIEVLQPGFDNIQTLTNLDTGTYFLEYNSLFGKSEKLKVVMTEFKNYSVDLCLDYIDYSKEKYKPIIDRLKDKEYYKILMSSQGCFHSSADTLTISREHNTYSATWTTNKKTLTQSDIDAIRHFEIELNYMSYEGCTTTDSYSIIYKNNTKKINDGSCSWNGAYHLNKKLWNQ